MGLLSQQSSQHHVGPPPTGSSSPLPCPEQRSPLFMVCCFFRVYLLWFRQWRFEGFTSEILLPQSGPKDICIKFPNRDAFIWGPGISYSSTACSEGCCFYIPANSAKVQEIEAKTVIPTWFRAKADGCASPSGAQTARLILNKDKNDSGSGAAICLKKEDGSFELLTGDTVGCKGKCCFFECKSCPKE